MQKYKQALTFVQINQSIIEDLHTEHMHQPRSLDYMIAVHTMSAFILLKMNKLAEAFQILEEVEKLVFLQVKYTLEECKTPQVQLYL